MTYEQKVLCENITLCTELYETFCIIAVFYQQFAFLGWVDRSVWVWVSVGGSVGGSVSGSVGGSVGRSVGRSVSPAFIIKSSFKLKYKCLCMFRNK